MYGTFDSLFHVGFALFLCVSAGSAGNALDDPESRFARLLAWIQSGIEEAGLGTSHPPVTETLALSSKGRFGYGLFARRRFEESDIICEIPLSHLISSANFGTVERGLNNVDNGLTLFLAKQKLLANSSPYSPYLDMIPAEFTLPRYWNQSSLHNNLNGSDFVEDLEQATLNLNARLDALSRNHNISREVLAWADDARQTRAMAAIFNDADSQTIMFPIFDLALHGDHASIDCSYDAGREVLIVKTRKRIYSGTEIWNGYLRFTRENDTEPSNNNEVLSTWGFASERITSTPGLRCCHFNMKSSEAEQLQLEIGLRDNLSNHWNDWGGWPFVKFKICDSAEWPEHRNFLGFLRQIASSATLPKLVKNKTASSWKIEKRALRMGQHYLEGRLQKFPETLEEDEALLANPASFTDPRVRFMVMLRKEEKVAITWWLKRFRQGLEASSGQSEKDRADESYLLDKPSKMSQLWTSIMNLLENLAHDATEAADQPLEFAVVVCPVISIVHIALSFIGWFCKIEFALWRPGWLLAIAAYGLIAAMCRWQMVKFTLDHQMTLVWITAIILWLGAMSFQTCLRIAMGQG